MHLTGAVGSRWGHLRTCHCSAWRSYQTAAVGWMSSRPAPAARIRPYGKSSKPHLTRAGGLGPPTGGPGRRSELLYFSTLQAVPAPAFGGLPWMAVTSSTGTTASGAPCRCRSHWWLGRSQLVPMARSGCWRAVAVTRTSFTSIQMGRSDPPRAACKGWRPSPRGALGTREERHHLAIQRRQLGPIHALTAKQYLAGRGRRWRGW
jgi:hypothetical protein